MLYKFNVRRKKERKKKIKYSVFNKFGIQSDKVFCKFEEQIIKKCRDHFVYSNMLKNKV